LKLVWTRPALSQLSDAREYIEVDNPRAASRVIHQIELSVNRLRAFPLLGRPGFRANTRELVVTNTPYVVVYRVDNDAVYILAVCHGATDWQNNL
jgi:addiction module RelE/StbE family toxin